LHTCVRLRDSFLTISSMQVRFSGSLT